MTIRLRVTALAAVAVFIVLAVTSWLVVDHQRRVLTEGVEEALAEEAASLLDEARSGEVADPIGGFLDDDAVAQLVSGDGRIVAATTGAPAEPLAPPAGEGNTWRTQAIPVVDDAAFRVLSITRGDVTVHVAAPLDDVDDAVSLLTRSLVVAVPAATVLLAALVWWLVGRTLRPVEAMRREVSDIGGRDLHRRVPEPRSGDEIGKLARTLNGMLDRIESSAERQRRFVADASHELRSPLTRMRTELEVDLAHPGEADHVRTHRRALEETEGLQRLVEDLLLLARSDGAAPPVVDELVDLRELIDEVVAAPAVAGLTVEVAVADPVEVRGDPGQLRRAVGNVVDNAIRHAHHTVSISLRGDGADALVVIADDGPGVPPEERDRIFERFARVDDARSATSGGAGLGLAIARDVVERHGGTIGVDPEWDQGARFVIRLPRRGTVASPRRRPRPGSSR